MDKVIKNTATQDIRIENLGYVKKGCPYPRYSAPPLEMDGWHVAMRRIRTIKPGLTDEDVCYSYVGMLLLLRDYFSEVNGKLKRNVYNRMQNGNKLEKYLYRNMPKDKTVGKPARGPTRLHTKAWLLSRAYLFISNAYDMYGCAMRIGTNKDTEEKIMGEKSEYDQSKSVLHKKAVRIRKEEIRLMGKQILDIFENGTPPMSQEHITPYKEFMFELFRKVCAGKRIDKSLIARRDFIIKYIRRYKKLFIPVIIKGEKPYTPKSIYKWWGDYRRDSIKEHLKATHILMEMLGINNNKCKQ